jgi:hypothetical protein
MTFSNNINYWNTSRVVAGFLSKLRKLLDINKKICIIHAKTWEKGLCATNGELILFIISMQ